MTHAKAFALVSEICPGQAGMLWNTTNYSGCDTATAVADQFGDDFLEEAEARKALELLAQGIVPSDWEVHQAVAICQTCLGDPSLNCPNCAGRSGDLIDEDDAE